jgi:NAD(P)-dependent dehydrogenase (short-subunit alcohol dehydrogenase family)
MDLGIAGRRAIVAASSGGLGYACAEALAREGVHVVINGRDAERLDAAAARLREVADVEVATVVGDIAADDTRAALREACGAPDILVTNNGGPNPGRFQQWGRDEWFDAVDANMVAPLLLIRDAIDGMGLQPRRGFGWLHVDKDNDGTGDHWILAIAYDDDVIYCTDSAPANITQIDRKTLRGLAVWGSVEKTYQVTRGYLLGV